MFDAVLVADRGEIAVRVLRSVRRLGLRAVALVTDDDAGALHTRVADEVVDLGRHAGAPGSYRSVEQVVDAAQRAGVDAVHPGYGFLAENAAFARACAEAGLTFVGPPPAAIEAMGDKAGASDVAAAAGVAPVPGVHKPAMSDADLVAAADELGLPLVLKAAAGGGGKGMRVVRRRDELAAAIADARSESAAAFGDDRLVVERLLDPARHIEVQVLADGHGAVVTLGERDCSLQRRAQKIVEEAPAPGVDATLRAQLAAAAAAVAAAVGYVNAGTVEFLVPAAGGAGLPALCFLEMNTRLQVEHGVTEAVRGLDLVEWQLRIAAGEALALPERCAAARGHAVEARVYAEDPAAGFLPTGGTVLAYDEPAVDGVRVDAGVRLGSVVGSVYDPLLAKVVAHADDRARALARLDAALAALTVLGVTTNVAFLRRLLADDDVAAARLDTALVERRLEELCAGMGPDDAVLAAAGLAALLEREPDAAGVVDAFAIADGWRVGGHAWTRLRLQPVGARRGVGPAEAVVVAVRGTPEHAEVAVGAAPAASAAAAWDDDGDEPGGGRALVVTIAGQRRRYRWARAGEVAWLGRAGAAWGLREQDQLRAARLRSVAAATGPVVAPLPGTVSRVDVAVGDAVVAGQALVVVEAMKMQHPVGAPADGVVARVDVAVGDQVGLDQPLALVEPAAPEAPETAEEAAP